MLALLGISTLASLVVSAVLGVRLLLLYARTRQLPELIMGSAFLGAGVVGYVFVLVGSAGADHMPAETARGFFQVGYAIISGGVILTYLFVWRVFRPESPLARVFVGIVCPVVAVTGLPFALPTVTDPGVALSGSQLFVFWLGHAVRIGSGAWGALEAGQYYRSMKRRQRLGLADPVITNRIALWGASALGSVVIFTSTAIANAGGESMSKVMMPAQILLISTVTLFSAVCQWLAFVPPRRYLGWIRRRTRSVGA
jgi:hypothetical protein